MKTQGRRTSRNVDSSKSLDNIIREVLNAENPQDSGIDIYPQVPQRNMEAFGIGQMGDDRVPRDIGTVQLDVTPGMLSGMDEVMNTLDANKRDVANNQALLDAFHSRTRDTNGVILAANQRKKLALQAAVQAAMGGRSIPNSIPGDLGDVFGPGDE
jgi:hypothetical protein